MVQSQEQRLHLAQDSFRRLMRRGATAHAQNLLEKLHAADLAEILRHMAKEEKRSTFGLIEDRVRAAHPARRAGSWRRSTSSPSTQNS